MSLKLTSSSIKATYLGFSMTPSLSTPLELSTWVQIGATFSYYKFKSGPNIKPEIFMFLNAKKLVSTLEPVADLPSATAPIFDPNTDQIFIGGGEQNSFLGVIGKIDIFNPGALFQYGKYLLGFFY